MWLVYTRCEVRTDKTRSLGPTPRKNGSTMRSASNFHIQVSSDCLKMCMHKCLFFILYCVTEEQKWNQVPTNLFQFVTLNEFVLQFIIFLNFVVFFVGTYRGAGMLTLLIRKKVQVHWKERHDWDENISRWNTDARICVECACMVYVYRYACKHSVSFG
jgi:hypothetical protein